MQVNIHTKGLNLSDEEKNYILKKMEKISSLAKRIKDESSTIKVEIDKDKTKSEQDSIHCIINLHVPKETIRAESRAAWVKEAVDLTKKKLLPQIEAYKEKFSHH